MQVTPRVYQSEAVKAALAGIRSSKKRALIVLATGLGKTLTVAFVTKEFRPKKTLFLVHNNFILKHAVDEFRLVFGEKTKMTTYNGMSRHGVSDADIVFATWQTMGKNLKRWKRNHFDLIIVDEAHHSEADTYRPVTDYFTGPKLGITATPDRQDGADIRDVFGPEVINVTLEEAVARGWLPRIEYHVITDESLDENMLQKIAGEIREGKKRFTMAEVNRRIFIKKRDVEITRIINGYTEKAVVFCASITHAERLCKSLDLADTFHSSKGENQTDGWKKNQEVLEALKNGKIRRVCAVNAFNEGVNVPSVGLVAFCRVTGVLTIFRQQLGRGLRPGKDKLIVLDFVGNLERIQLVLGMMNKISDLHEQYTSKEEIEREGYVRQKFEVSGKGFEFTFSDKIVDLMKILDHCEREFYPTWQEASEAVRKLKLKFKGEYFQQYTKDDRLPSNPQLFYKDFPNWPLFLRGESKKNFYTQDEASQACRKLGITTRKEYKARYKEDPRLPGDPLTFYPNFPPFVVFLGGKKKYGRWQEASRAAKKLGISSITEYRKRCTQDLGLYKFPDIVYEDFPGWNVFLGLKQPNFYPTWEVAAKALRRLKIKSVSEYKSRRIEDERLPKSPLSAYPSLQKWSKLFRKEK